jgi:5-methyltetrahydropteroyltriglutamate--homocysteine methyltransferase
MPRTARADTVGSLLRPEYLRETRQRARDGKATMTELRAAEDKAIVEAIDMQERVGLDVISDGEMRRVLWATSAPLVNDSTYTPPLAGFSYFTSAMSAGWQTFWRDNEGNNVGAPPGSRRATITQPLQVVRDIVGDEYAYLKGHAHRRIKYTFPAPSFHRVFWHPDHSRDAYPTVEDWLYEVRDYMRREIVDRLVALGCDYIQLDAPNYGQTYTDPDVRAAFEAEGHNLDKELAVDADVDNSVFEGLSEEVTRAIHVCRGNRPGGFWSAAGGYEFAEAMFPRLTHVDTLLLEYDTPRSGTFEPLKHVRPDTNVVLGLITTKEGEIEDWQQVEARIKEASEIVPLERLALSSQCGFASGEAGNPITEQQQEEKLRLIVETARRMWREG